MRRAERRAPPPPNTGGALPRRTPALAYGRALVIATATIARGRRSHSLAPTASSSRSSFGVSESRTRSASSERKPAACTTERRSAMWPCTDGCYRSRSSRAKSLRSADDSPSLIARGLLDGDGSIINKLCGPNTDYGTRFVSASRPHLLAARRIRRRIRLAGLHHDRAVAGRTHAMLYASIRQAREPSSFCRALYADRGAASHKEVARMGRLRRATLARLTPW